MIRTTPSGKEPFRILWAFAVRNSPLKNDRGTLRVVCFGDSSTFGIGARMQDTWPAQLQDMLAEDANRGTPASPEVSGARRVEVINAGVPGYTSYQGLQHMRQKLDLLVSGHRHGVVCQQ